MKTKRRTALDRQRELETKLSEAEKAFAKNPLDTNLESMLAVKASLNALLTHKAEQSIKLARQKLYEFGNKPNKYLARLINKKSDSHCISAIKDSGGKRRTDLESINKFLRYITINYLRAINLYQIRGSPNYSGPIWPDLSSQLCREKH